MTEESKAKTVNKHVDIQRLANLCSLVIPENISSTLGLQLEEIFSYFESLSQYNTQNINPMSHVHQDNNVLREDIVNTSLTREEALSLAPERKGAFFKVPLIID
jgi:aspartyl-tRNA(Asn)/glutamyl-tRNA(Gln) amidotransferase subunit C